ncbi:MAG: hypothetical protein MZU97_09250 [Bacillus subtilis]|nr:hypothetical protein [Bacillus subtilis]
MPFVYRLEKVLTYRIKKKEEQLNIVRQAIAEVQRIQDEINKNKSASISLRQNMRSAAHIMMESYDIYIKHINDVIDQLEIEKQAAIQRLEEEQQN